MVETPFVPEEVDVFSIPHSRMKDLVNAYVEMIKKTNFTNDLELQLLLESLLKTFMEFKTHERIENQFIMRKLKNKLRQLSIKNSAVCNCHSDDSLSEMMHFIENGYRKKTEQDRLNFEIQLKQALDEFTESFLPHMKEEEEVFQPLLLQYFSFEELRDLRQKVLQQHFVKEQVELFGKKTGIIEKGENEEKDCNAQIADSQDRGRSGDTKNYISNLPPELTIKIFSHLNPRELVRCRQVNHEWSRLAVAPELWRDVWPTFWAQGEWQRPDISLVDDLESEDDDDDGDDCFNDEDFDASSDDCEDYKADFLTENQYKIDKESKMLTGLIKHVLPQAGKGVRRLVLKNNRALDNGMLVKLLQLCPNIEVLDLSQTKISDFGLHRLGKFGIGSCLKKVVLSGCGNISDATLVRLAMAQHQSLKSHYKSIEYLPEAAATENVVIVHTKPKKRAASKMASLIPNDSLHVGPSASRSDEWTAAASIATQTAADCDAESGCCGEEGGTNTVSSSAALDCLCEAYYNECHVTIEDGCQMALTVPCRTTKQTKDDVEFNSKPRQSDTKQAGYPLLSLTNGNEVNPTAAEQSTTEDDSRVKTRGHLWNVAHKKKDPDYDLDFSAISPDFGDAVTTRESIVPADLTSHDDCKHGRCCHPSCDRPDTEEHYFELSAIEECLPKELNARTRNARTIAAACCNEKPKFKLEHLNLSGCFQITDVGIRALARIGSYPDLKWLDLSGCLRLTAVGIRDLVAVCPSLADGELYYCDNVDGPLADSAGGCRNLECKSRVCCRSGQ